MLLILFFTSIQVLLLCREADATITWTVPPPQRGPLQTNDGTVRKTTKQLVINSPEELLKWEFTLSGETLDRVFWNKDSVAIGRKTSAGMIVIAPTDNFQEHFGISASDPATLIIKNVTEADAAVFRCSVQTNIKTWSDEIQVEIVEAPRFTHPTQTNASYNDGSPVDISCTAQGTPDPDVRWIYNGQEKSSGSKTAHLIFSPISEVDAGTYTCSANNSAGIKEKQLHIFVNFCDDNPSYAEGPDGCAAQAAVKNYCNDYYDFMSENCAKSCGFCSEEP